MIVVIRFDVSDKDREAVAKLESLDKPASYAQVRQEICETVESHFDRLAEWLERESA